MIQRALPYLVIVALVIGSHWLAYRHGVTTTAEHYKVELATWQKDRAQQVAWLEKQARQAEQAAAERMAAIDRQYAERMKNELDSREDIIADLRAGNLRLRERFRCAGSPTPEAGTVASLDAGRQASGLSADDAEFFIREAARADAVAIELQQCKAIARSDRASQGDER